MISAKPNVPTSGPEPAPFIPELPDPLEPQEPPMNLYLCSPSSPPARSCPGPDQDLSAAVIQILEQVSVQNQLLIDLQAAVNGLTAAILCRQKG